ncbi:MAG: hypothetical protein MJ085_04070 [Clostridia bacterium]|nr:hypothetical protein [Clostridia bacterium]
MKNLKRNTARFFERNRNKGIPKLLTILAIARVVLFIVINMDQSRLLYSLLVFDPEKIMHWQLWRLISFVLLPDSGSIIGFLLSVIFYIFLGRMLESSLGTLRFNVYFFFSVLLLDAVTLLIYAIEPVAGFACSYALPLMLDYSLLFAFAVRFGETSVYLFFILPLKMKYLAWIDLFMLIMYAVSAPGLAKLLPLFALLPCVLFFFSELPALLPSFMQRKPYRTPRRQVIDSTGYSERPAKKAAKKEIPLYHQKCTICGRTDLDSPDLEFRYCSKCRGYHCYCMDHISNHPHILDEE